MTHKKKVIRTKRLYRKRGASRRTVSRILFVVLIAALVCFGFIVMKEWSLRFGKNASSRPSSDIGTSSIQTPSAPVISTPVSSQPQVLNGISKTADIGAEILLKGKDEIAKTLAKIKGEGYTGVSVELKTIKGILAYQSNNEMAKAYGTIAPNGIDIKALFTQITDAGLLPVARISTLKDQTAPHVSKENSYAFGTGTTTNWLDNSVENGGKPWLNPYMDNARKYICDISKEIYDAGFKTIILENVMFPDKNTKSMNTIKKEPSREAILNQLVSQVQAAVPECNVIRSLDITAVDVINKPLLEISGTYTSKDITLLLDLQKIEANKEKICITNGIVDQVGYDKNITAVQVVGNLLSILKDSADGNLIPIMSKADFLLLEPILKEHNIMNYVVINL